MDLPGALLEQISTGYALRPLATATQASERVWRLQTATGDVAIKLRPSEQHARAAKEAALLAYLNQRINADTDVNAGANTGVHTGTDAAKHTQRNTADTPPFRVQSLLRTTNGAALWNGPNACALVTRWAPGRFKTYDQFTPAEWGGLGATLAALHSTLDQYPALSDTLHSRLTALDVDAIQRELRAAPARAAPDVRRPLQDYVDLCLRLIAQHHPGSLRGFPLDDPQHPIHNDYNQFNYLFDAPTPLILDWEAAIGAPGEYELVRCLNHLPLESPGLASLFVRAYLNARPLRPERMAWAVDAACLQHGVKRWIVRGWLENPGRFEAHLHGALRMATALVGARQRLIDFFSHHLQSPT